MDFVDLEFECFEMDFNRREFFMHTFACQIKLHWRLRVRTMLVRTILVVRTKF